MGIFALNCKLFEHKNPKARALLSFTKASHLKKCLTERGEVNLVDTSVLPLRYLHSQKGAQQEAEISYAWKETPVLVVYGIGLGYGYLALEKNLEEDKEKQLIFLEDDLATLLCFLHTETATKLLKNPRAHLYYLEHSQEGVHVLQEIAWGICPKKIDVIASPYYLEHKKGHFEEIKNRLLFETSDIHAVLDEYFQYGIPFFRNFWSNIFELPHSHQASALFGAFRNKPAVVVGAGPSLTKQLPFLKEIQNNVLIVAGGSAVNALTEAGIRPHFAGAIDPNPTQYIRVRQGFGFEIPFFYRHRVLHEVMSLLSGPKLYLNGGDGYTISEWIEKKCKIKGKVLGGGHSIANFCVEIAYALGARPIILVGFDLAYTNHQIYAQGVEEKARAPQCAEEEVLWHDVYGNPIMTAWKWLVEAKWISEFQKKHPRLALFNATEGGLAIDGVKNITLEQAKERFFSADYDVNSYVHTLIEGAPKVAATKESIVKEIAKMKKSLERVMGALDEIIEVCKKKGRKSPLESVEAIFAHEKLHQEIAYRYIVEVFDRMRTKLDTQKFGFLVHPLMTQKQKEEITREQLIQKYIFLKEVAVVNFLLIGKQEEKLCCMK